MLEELLGAGKSSPPPNNNSQPTTQPSSPPAPEPTSGTTEPVEDETAENDMPADQHDGTYSPAPATDGNTPNEDEDETKTPDQAMPPVATAPSQPRPANGNTAESIPSEDAVGNMSVAPATSSANKTDHVSRITDLIASYEKLLFEPAAEETDEARIRAMELAQNRVLTSLIDDLSTSDARNTLLGDEAEQVSLVSKYYAEGGR